MTSKLKQLVLRVAPAFKLLSLAAMGVIAWQSLQPSTGIVTLNHGDKLLHFLAYGLLATLLRLGWPRSWGGTLLLVSVGFGIIVEILQGTMSLGRTASIADAIANTVGAITALFILHVLKRRISAP